MSDYHVHLHEHGPYRGVGVAPGEYPDGHIEAYVETALSQGVEEVGFTEHLYRCVESEPVLGEFWQDPPVAWVGEQTRDFVLEDRTLSLDGYVDAVLGSKGAGLPVLLGLEVDFFPETIDAVLDLLAPYPWDFLIGSVHWIGAWSVDHSRAVAEFERRGVDQAYRDYFELETALAGSGTVDVLAHVDVVKKFGHRPSQEPIDSYRAVAAAAASSGTAVELNSNGLNVPVAEIYPAPAFLAEFFAAGVPITLGSDAHKPDEVGRGRAASIELARGVGYSERVRFAERKARPIDL
ncbi:MAG: histidinol-phosphatase HisJ family protein [Acidimicrobiia bacterium]|nr:histidinol-phosphatase HisJ family protein [Acidimicrobiia bacterium]